MWTANLKFSLLFRYRSPSPYATAQLFEELKSGKDEPDPEAAAALGSEEAMNDLDVIAERYNANIHDFLIKLPGIHSKNIAGVLRHGVNLKNLIKKTQIELTELLGNSADAKLLWDALNVAFKPAKVDEPKDKPQSSKFKRGFSGKFKSSS